MSSPWQSKVSNFCKHLSIFVLINKNVSSSKISMNTVSRREEEGRREKGKRESGRRRGGEERRINGQVWLKVWTEVVCANTCACPNVPPFPLPPSPSLPLHSLSPPSPLPLHSSTHSSTARYCMPSATCEANMSCVVRGMLGRESFNTPRRSLRFTYSSISRSG